MAWPRRVPCFGLFFASMSLLNSIVWTSRRLDGTHFSKAKNHKSKKKKLRPEGPAQIKMTKKITKVKIRTGLAQLAECLCLALTYRGTPKFSSAPLPQDPREFYSTYYSHGSVTPQFKPRPRPVPDSPFCWFLAHRLHLVGSHWIFALHEFHPTHFEFQLISFQFNQIGPATVDSVPIMAYNAVAQVDEVASSSDSNNSDAASPALQDFQHLRDVDQLEDSPLEAAKTDNQQGLGRLGSMIRSMRICTQAGTPTMIPMSQSLAFFTISVSLVSQSL